MANGKQERIAVLIDADNASAKIVDGLFEEIAKLGEASVRRIYGDFSGPQSKPWADVLTRHAILPQQQFAYVKGKNASDIALVIDAMDLLQSGRFDGFCLVSSDSDFTRLAARIREEGVDVYGVGERKTPESFRNACRRFIFSENLLPQEPAALGAVGTPQVLEPPANSRDLIRRALSQSESEEGWTTLGWLGWQLLKLAPDFDSRTYGHKKLLDLVRSLTFLELRQADGGQVEVREKYPATRSSGPRAQV